MTAIRSADAQPGDLAVHHSTGMVLRIRERKDPAAPQPPEIPFKPGWWVDDLLDGHPTGGLADEYIDHGDDWTLVTVDQVRAMAAALRAGVPG